MTENKRFGMVKTKDYDLYVPVDEMKFYIFPSFEDELDCIRVVNALNDLEEKSRVNGKLASQYLEENEQLKKEKESWKSSACNNLSFNSILLHELDIAQEQGYKLSDPFKKLMREKND